MCIIGKRSRCHVNPILNVCILVHIDCLIEWPMFNKLSDNWHSYATWLQTTHISSTTLFNLHILSDLQCKDMCMSLATLQGKWFMMTEEVGQVYQAVVPMPTWFRFLVTYQEMDGRTGLTLGILLALGYLILKVRFLQKTTVVVPLNNHLVKLSLITSRVKSE